MTSADGGIYITENDTMAKKIVIEHSSLEEPLDVEVMTTGDLEKWGNIETAAIMKIAEALNDRE